MDPCKDCGGWGKGLVQCNRLCNHCTRARNQTARDAKAKAREQVWIEQRGYVDVTPTGDLGVLAKWLNRDDEHRYPDDMPVEGCPCRIQYVGRLLDQDHEHEQEIFETTRDVVNGKFVGGTDDPHEFKLLRDEAIKAWDLMVSKMKRGDKVDIIVQPEYAYGKQGYPPKVRPNTAVRFELELVDFDKALPKFPSQQALQRARKERDEQERKRLEENPPPSLDERIAESEKSRAKGNEEYRVGEYGLAKKSYDSAFVNVFFTEDEWNFLLTQEERQRVNETKLTLHLNRAMCKLKLNKHGDALWDCDNALRLDPSNRKGLYRRAVVYTEKARMELSKESRNEFWETDKAKTFLQHARNDLEMLGEMVKDHLETNRPVRKLIQEVKQLDLELRRHEREYRKQQTVLYRDNMIHRLDECNTKDLTETESDPFADIPDLEE